MARLATVIIGRSRMIVAVGLALAAAAGWLGSSVAGRLSPYGVEDPATASVKAERAIEHATGLSADVDLVALVPTPGGPASPTTRRTILRVARELRADRAVGVVRDYSSHDRAQVARDGRSQYIAVTLRAMSDKAKQDAADRIGRRIDVPAVRLGGFAKASADVNHIVESDIQRAELMAFPILFFLTLLFFRSLIAAALPLIVGGMAIAGTFLVLRVLSDVADISIFALNLTTGLGLGLAIDYSLFIVARYREEIARVGVGPEALRRTMQSAGRTVLFSSLTVATAVASLLVFPQRFLYSMGMAGAAVAVLAAIVALIVLPAILTLLGERINFLAPRWLQRRAADDARPVSTRFWYRLSRFVMRRPVSVALASAAVLIVIGLPFTHIRFTTIDASSLPPSAESRQVDLALTRDFAPDETAPMYIAVASAPSAAVRRYAATLRRLRDVAVVTDPRPVAAQLSVITVLSRRPPLSAQSQRLVHAIRATAPPALADVGGRAAAFVDLKASLEHHLVAALGIIVAATFVLLWAMTGSVVLPLKALLMNVLTLSAAFGILVLIFQDGRFQGALSYTSQGAIEASMPVLLFAIAFGLSTDYGVFLLARIKEARDAGHPDGEAVAIGLERTGRIVTSAALLMSIAIGSFATSQIIFIKETGIGIALAVLIDASIVRALLVPATMTLLGRLNWWSPAPLRRFQSGGRHSAETLSVAPDARGNTTA